jgi:hypothetical protein
MPISEKHKVLFETFRSKALDPDGLFLLNAHDALDFLNAGLREGLVLAGVEGFLITDNGAYEPRQDFSNIYHDWRGTCAELENRTRDLILRGSEAGIRFDVVFVDD